MGPNRVASGKCTPKGRTLPATHTLGHTSETCNCGHNYGSLSQSWCSFHTPVLERRQFREAMMHAETSTDEAQGCASATPNSFQQDVIMDPNIWSTVTQSILELIFSRLPLQSLVRLRVLSKQWQSSFSSPAFQQAFCDRRPKDFAVVESERTNPKRVWAYDARARKWFGLPLHYLPFSYLVAADGGLLCFVKFCKDEECLQVVVCNPLTCTWRELPPVTGVQMIPKAFHMKVDLKSRHYTIKFLGSHNSLEPEVFHVYSSETNSWVKVGWNRHPDVVGRYILVNVYHGSIHTYDILPGDSSSILYPPGFEHDIVAQVEGPSLFQAEEGSLFLLKTESKLKEEWGRDAKHGSEWEFFCRIPNAAELENYFFNVFLFEDVILLVGRKRHLFYSALYDVDPENHRDPEDTDSDTNSDNLMLMLDMSTKTWTDVTEHSIEPACLSKFIVELRLDAAP